MKNVKLEKSKRGWFLTIGDDIVNNRWAVSSIELWCVKKMIEDNLDEIMKEIELIDTKEKSFISDEDLEKLKKYLESLKGK